MRERVRLHRVTGASTSLRPCQPQRKVLLTVEASARVVEHRRTILRLYGARCLRASISTARREGFRERRALTANLTSLFPSPMRMEIQKNNRCKSQSLALLPLLRRQRQAILRPALRRRAALRPAIRHLIILPRAIRFRATRPATIQAGEMRSRICKHRVAGRNTDRARRTS